MQQVIAVASSPQNSAERGAAWVEQRLITAVLNSERVCHVRCSWLINDSWNSGRILSEVPTLFPWLTVPFCMLWLCLRVLGAGQITLPDNSGTYGAYIFCHSQRRFWWALTGVSQACGHDCDWQQCPDFGAWTIPHRPHLPVCPCLVPPLLTVGFHAIPATLPIIHTKLTTREY